MSDEIQRRNRIDRNITAELVIRDAVWDVEALGAHPQLTDVVNLLTEAREKLADWIDNGHPGSNTNLVMPEAV